MITPPHVYIREVAGKGRGVFAQKAFTQDEIIEQAPVILLPNRQWELLEQTVLKDYYFYWTEDTMAFGLGYGAIYNHAASPNIRLVRQFETNMMEFVALRNIEPHEELAYDYDCPLWFDVIN